jgi:hypothetical protein
VTDELLDENRWDQLSLNSQQSQARWPRFLLGEYWKIHIKEDVDA